MLNQILVNCICRGTFKFPAWLCLKWQTDINLCDITGQKKMYSLVSIYAVAQGYLNTTNRNIVSSMHRFHENNQVSFTPLLWISTDHQIVLRTQCMILASKSRSTHNYHVVCKGVATFSLHYSETAQDDPHFIYVAPSIFHTPCIFTHAECITRFKNPLFLLCSANPT